jgi:hypothetical protein
MSEKIMILFQNALKFKCCKGKNNCENENYLFEVLFFGTHLLQQFIHCCFQLIIGTFGDPSHPKEFW